MKRWTEEEDKKVIETFNKNYTGTGNIRKAFRTLAKELGRTPDSIVTRYYCKLNKNLNSQ